MTAPFAYRRPSPFRRSLPSLALLIATVLTTAAHAADTIAVVLDQATIGKIPEHVSRMVIGNPLIAYVSVQPGGLLIVTGKGYGTTNLIALDRSSAVLAGHTIEVRGPRDQVVWVYRGLAREISNARRNAGRASCWATRRPFSARL